MPLVEVEQTTRDKRMPQQTGPFFHVPGAPNRMSLPVLAEGLGAPPPQTAARMQPMGRIPLVHEDWSPIHRAAQAHGESQRRPAILRNDSHRGVMHMLVGHGMVRSERWVKDAHSLERRAPRFRRRGDQDPGRQRQLTRTATAESPGQSYLAADLEDHLHGRQAAPKVTRGRHSIDEPPLFEAGHHTIAWPIPRRAQRRCGKPFVSGTIEVDLPSPLAVDTNPARVRRRTCECVFQCRPRPPRLLRLDETYACTHRISAPRASLHTTDRKGRLRQSSPTHTRLARGPKTAVIIATCSAHRQLVSSQGESLSWTRQVLRIETRRRCVRLAQCSPGSAARRPSSSPAVDDSVGYQSFPLIIEPLAPHSSGL